MRFIARVSLAVAAVCLGPAWPGCPSSPASAATVRKALVAGPAGASVQAAPAAVRRALTSLPLRFEARPDAGPVRYVSRGPLYSVHVKPDEVVVALGARPARQAAPRQAGVLRLRFEGGHAGAPMSATGELPGRTNYLVGPPSQWRTGVRAFARVRAERVYRGIDVVYYGSQDRLEFDLVAAPRARTDRITLALDSGSGTTARLRPSGDIAVRLGENELLLKKPFTYQQTAAGRKEIESSFFERAPGRFGIRVGAHDPALPLVIDPVLAYATYLGGSLYDFGLGVAVDAEGSAYVAGYTSSPDFTTTGEAYDRSCGTNGLCNFTALDAFVTKFNAAGAPVYSTFLGGSRTEYGYGIAVDAAGNAYFTGYTESNDLAVVGGFQSQRAGGNDIFVAKLDPSGSQLLYSTYLGGSGEDITFATAVADNDSNIYVTGYTESPNFPTTPQAADRTCGADGNCSGGNRDAFLAKINTAATGRASLAYSTFLGGSGQDEARAVNLDSRGFVYVAGFTVSTDFPTTAGALKRACGADGQCSGGFRDAFVTKLDTLASGAESVVYSTYLGGAGTDVARGIALDGAGSAFITGSTSALDFPVSAGMHGFAGGPEDGFVARVSADGSRLIWSGYIGGSGEDVSEGVALDAANNVYIAGYTYSTDFPLLRPFQTRAGGNGNEDGFVAKYDPAGTLLYSSYLGGGDNDRALDIAADAAGTAYVVGYTESQSSFPTTAGAFRTGSNGSGEVFFAKVTDPSAVQPRINTGGVVNGTFNGQAPAAGGIGSLFGTVLAGETGTASSVPLPTTLSSVSVTVDRIPAPLFYVSPQQINFQMPWEVSAGSQHTIIVSLNGTVSPSVALSTPAFSPGIFTLNQAGTGQGAILISGTADLAAPAGSIPGRAARPVESGGFISIFSTGLGAVSNAPATGTAAGADPLSATIVSPTVTIGGIPAQVTFSGLAPGFVGLYQVDARVPLNAPAGAAVPVVISMGGTASNTATIAVQ